MRCFYHSADFDGLCSAAIVQYRFSECELHGIDYGESFPWDIIVPNEIVFMVDFSLDRDDMLHLNNVCNLIWIDHHKSALEKMGDITEEDISGSRVIGKAGCELTWEFVMGTTIPEAVRLLGRYDVWDHKDPWVVPFQYGMRRYPKEDVDPNNKGFWNYLFTSSEACEPIVDAGKIIMDFINADNASYVKKYAFETYIDGHLCIAVDRLNTNSLIFNSVYNKDRHDFMMVFGWSPSIKKWKVSLYTEKYDASEVAKKRGGGGHKGAAGFVCDELPFLLIWELKGENNG